MENAKTADEVEAEALALAAALVVEVEAEVEAWSGPMELRPTLADPSRSKAEALADGWRTYSPRSLALVTAEARRVAARYPGLDRAEVEARTIDRVALSTARRPIGQADPRRTLAYLLRAIGSGQAEALAAVVESIKTGQADPMTLADRQWSYRARLQARDVAAKLPTGRGSMPYLAEAERVPGSPNWASWVGLDSRGRPIGPGGVEVGPSSHYGSAPSPIMIGHQADPVPGSGESIDQGRVWDTIGRGGRVGQAVGLALAHTFRAVGRSGQAESSRVAWSDAARDAARFGLKADRTALRRIVTAALVEVEAEAEADPIGSRWVEARRVAALAEARRVAAWHRVEARARTLADPIRFDPRPVEVEADPIGLAEVEARRAAVVEAEAEARRARTLAEVEARRAAEAVEVEARGLVWSSRVEALAAVVEARGRGLARGLALAEMVEAWPMPARVGPSAFGPGRGPNQF